MGRRRVPFSPGGDSHSMLRGTNSGNKQRENYGRGEYQIDAPDFMLTPEAMVAHLRRTLVSPSYKPPLLPSIALEQVTHLDEGDTGLAQIAQSAL